MPLTKHLSVYAEPAPKWPEASPLITDRWVLRRWSLWVATTPSSHGQIDTGETSISCPRPTRPLRQKPGGRISELLSVSETGLFSFVRNWPRPLGGPSLQSGSAVCCRRRLQQALMASFAPRTLSARYSTPRRHCA